MSLQNAVRNYWAFLSPHHRRRLVLLLVLMLAGAFAELATIGALLPFLGLIANPDGSAALRFVQPMLSALGMAEPDYAILALTGLFALAALVSAALRLVLLWMSRSFIEGINRDLSTKLYADTLREPYLFHTSRNTSEIIATISKVQILADNVLTPSLQGIIALVVASFIIVGLILIDPIVAFVAGTGFAAIYLAVTLFVRKRLGLKSGVIARAQGARVKAMQEGLGAIRDVLIDRSQPVFIESFSEAATAFRDARVRIGFIANAPRYIVEAAGMVMIAMVAVAVVGRPGGLAQAIPVLGALALGAQRLLPLIQQVYNGWAQFTGNRQVVYDLATLLERPIPVACGKEPALPFERSIAFTNVSYTYTASRSPAIRDVSLEIPKGARVGIAGKTGSGKSTLMDLVLGLLEPSAGEIRVDRMALDATTRPAWQRNIAHVPQFIYLTDATIAENIAFGVRRDRIDHDRVRRAAEQAELAAVVDILPEGYNTRIGERGVQLSGGQRQRIGIARALYKQASVLVFDEATSALDTETESAVMDAIGHLDRDLTILIIAHRLSTLDGCDMVVRLEAGHVAAIENRAGAATPPEAIAQLNAG